jgi:hypothetical protein
MHKLMHNEQTLGGIVEFNQGEKLAQAVLQQQQRKQELTRKQGPAATATTIPVAQAADAATADQSTMHAREQRTCRSKARESRWHNNTWPRNASSMEQMLSTAIRDAETNRATTARNGQACSQATEAQ